MVPIITTQCFTLWCMQNRDESVAKSSYKTKHVCVMAAGWVGGRMVWDGAIKQRWKGAEQGTLARRWSTVRLRLQRRGNQLNTLLEEFLALVSLWFLKDSTTFTLEVSFLPTLNLERRMWVCHWRNTLGRGCYFFLRLSVFTSFVGKHSVKL